MKLWLKRALMVAGAVVAVGCVSAGGYVKAQTSAFDASMDKVYDVPVPPVKRSTDPAVIARGKHLAESVGACATRLCHGADLGGGSPVEMGPVATLTGPNLTGAGMGAAYDDGELARLVTHGLKKDGRSVRFMPSDDFSWLPDSDVAAVVSYIRSVPSVERPNGKVELGALGKVLDRREELQLDVARHIDHARVDKAPPPQPTAAYGVYVARLCLGCHGKGLSGGRIPGTPSSIPTPTNITPHESGLRGWTYADFERLLNTGVKKNGQKLDPFMPIEAFSKLDEIEKKALWEHLQTVPPLPFGGR